MTGGQREHQLREGLRLDVAGALWGAAFVPVGYHHRYGSVVSAGYLVEDSIWPDAARVSHALPDEDLGDPNRRSSHEQWQIRLDALQGYARVLEAGGFVLERCGARPGASEPWLIVRRCVECEGGSA